VFLVAEEHPMTTKTLELWIAVDSDGDYAFAPEEDSAVNAYQEEVGGLVCLRTVKVNVTLTLPVPIEVNVTVPDEAGQTVTAEVSHG
jgi:hypothetical protein